MSEYPELYDAILTGDKKAAVAQTKEALSKNADPDKLVSGTMVPAMDEVGRRFEAEEYFIPELMIAARAMKASLELVRPLLAERGIQMVGRVLVGTVEGDLHDIGKNLVASMLEGGGFEVIDLGVNVNPQKFIEACKDHKPDIVGLSALLTTTMPAIKTTIDALKESGVRDGVKVMVGGAPVTKEFADQVGADAYGDSARTAVTLARQFVGAESA